MRWLIVVGLCACGLPGSHGGHGDDDGPDAAPIVDACVPLTCEQVVGVEVYVVGVVGDVYHFKIGVWTAEHALATGSVHVLRASGADLWLGGDHGVLLRRAL